MLRTWLTGALLFLGLASGCGMPAPLRVMSFNIRYADNHPVNGWDVRRPLVVQTIRDYGPDLLGLQEVVALQAGDLRAELPEYGYLGVGREDGREAGEQVPILYRTRTFQLVRGGHLWLSEEPERAGSKGWDAALPRMATWARLRFRSNPLAEVVVINTHFDHVGEQARLESARLLRRMTDGLSGTPIILMGDFNAVPGSEPHVALTRDAGNLAELRDTFAWLPRAAGPQAPGSTAATSEGEAFHDGTYNAFRPVAEPRRIDWILCNRRFEIQGAGIDRRLFDGRPASDHFAVTAVLRLLPVTASGAL